MSRLFISHASANNAIALALGQWLESQGWSDYFLDVHADRGIAPGERWMAALTGAVDRCEAVLFLVSPAWRDSKYCFAEFFEAKKLGKRIFGVIVEPIALSELPEQMTAEWQVCDLCHADEPVTFSVERPPLLPRTDVAFPKAGLDALARGLRKAGLAPATFEWPPAGEPDRSPYPGLRALDRADAAVFFGREAAIVRGIDQIRLTGERGVEPLFVILGASGAGKSSFLRAGLLPRLARDSDHFIVLPTLRGERAALSGPTGLWAVLRQALEQAGQPMSLAQVRELVAAQGLGRVLQRLRGRPEKSGGTTGATHSTDARTLVVPIDQFEELFATDGQAEATEFLQLITQALPAAGSGGSPGAGRLLLLVTIRSDALPTLQSHPLLRELKPVLFSLPAMAPSNFKDVIEGPARRHSETQRLTIDPALTEALLADAQGPDALPLLALTLEWLLRDFGQREGTELGLAQYLAIGRVSGVIDRAVQRALAQPDHPPAIPRTPAEQDALLHRLFGFIATVDPDTLQPKRRVALRSDLRQALGAEGDSLISRLVEQRLLVADAPLAESGGDAAETIEIAHEALLRQWGVMQRWLAEMTERLSTLESLRRSASDWQRSNRDEVLLVHTGHRLGAAAALRQDEQLRYRLDAGDSDYLEACRTRDDHFAREREEQLNARARWQRRFARVLGIATIGVAALLGWIVNQTREVSIQTSIVLSAAAERAADDGYFDRAARLGILAARSSWLYPRAPDVRGPLVHSLVGNRQLATFKNIESAVFSPDGQRVLTASTHSSAQFWDSKTGAPLEYENKKLGPVNLAIFSPDGRQILTAMDEIANSWDSRTGLMNGVPLKHQEFVNSAAFSPDGQRIVTVDGVFENTIRLWDAQTGQPISALVRFTNADWSSVFSPRGHIFVSPSEFDMVQLWDASSGQSIGQPIEHVLISPPVFDPAGDRLLTVTGKNRDLAKLWDIRSRRYSGISLEHRDEVLFAMFSPDGKSVLTASADGIAQLWDARTGQSLGLKMKHDAPIESAAFSPDGQRLFTAASDSVFIWNTQTGEPVGSTLKHINHVKSITVSPDGSRILTLQHNNIVQEWSPHTGAQLGTSMRHDSQVTSASYSSDGESILTITLDRTAKLWAAAISISSTNISLEQDTSQIALSPDGKFLLTISEDNTSRLWDTQSGQSLGISMKLAGYFRYAKFSPDDGKILTISDLPANTTRSPVKSRTPSSESPPSNQRVSAEVDDIIRYGAPSQPPKIPLVSQLWDVRTGKELGKQMKFARGILTAAFSPDGPKILAISAENKVQLVEAESGREINLPIPENSPLKLAAFSRDGSRFMTVTSGNVVQVWSAKSGTMVGSKKELQENVSGAAISQDGRLIAAVIGDQVEQWNADTGKPFRLPLNRSDFIHFAVYSPRGDQILIGGADGVQIRDIHSGKIIGKRIEGQSSLPISHTSTADHIIFSFDGRKLLTRSGYYARPWDTQSGEPLGPEIGKWGLPQDGSFDANGTLVLAVLLGKDVRVLRVPSHLPDSIEDLINFSCNQFKYGGRTIDAVDFTTSRILPHGFQVGDDVCKGLPSAAATVH